MNCNEKYSSKSGVCSKPTLELVVLPAYQASQTFLCVISEALRINNIKY